MQLPETLRRAIDELASSHDVRTLARASRELTASYQSGSLSSPAMDSAEHRAAYLLVRTPATYAACVHALRQLRDVCPDLSPSSMLDLGAGPGTAAWATSEVFPSLATVSAFERDPSLIEMGRRLMVASQNSALSSARWTQGDLRTKLPGDDFDLVVLSYALGELQPGARAALLNAAWQRTRQAFLIVEPGTRTGASTIVDVRRWFLDNGASLAAPCPHDETCPMAAGGDWCHFAERIERGSLHRRLKGGELGYEDEKFSYVAAVRNPVARASARIVRHPLHRPGHLQFTLCTAVGLQSQTVTKSQKDRYKLAKKSSWGDPWQAKSE